MEEDSKKTDSKVSADDAQEPDSESGRIEAEQSEPRELEPVAEIDDVPELENGGSASTSENNTVRESTKRKTFFITLVILFILVVLSTAAAIFLYKLSKNIENITEKHALRVDSITSQLDELDRDNKKQQTDFVNFAGENKRLLAQVKEKDKALEARMQTNESRLQLQNRRLLAMSTTSREDWLLAEAEYLLRLANQRVLVEHSASGAIGLLEEADAILRDLEDPDLFSLRRIIQDDLVALKLVETVDVEGIYLTLNALANQVENLPIVRESIRLESKPSAAQTEPVVDTEGRVSNAFRRLKQKLDRYYRVIDHQEKPKVLLPPDASAYLQLNLRLMIERAQLALLREQQRIYESSLNQSLEWLEKYYPETKPITNFKDELLELKQRNILIALPDISTSLEMLHSYIDQLHQLASDASTNKQKETK